MEDLGQVGLMVIAKGRGTNNHHISELLVGLADASHGILKGTIR